MYVFVILLVLCGWVSARPKGSPEQTDRVKTHHKYNPWKTEYKIKPEEKTADFWNKDAQDVIAEKLSRRNIENVAKNVIIFIGDGMSLPTLAATRMYMGGEEIQLSFEKLPHTALAKTYCVNVQTGDSACTTTATLAGVKNLMNTIGVTAAVGVNDCDAMILEENQVHSIARWSQDAGKRTGIVTTTVLTDATPAATYAHTANRHWYTDTDVIGAGLNATKCRDIAYQLIKGDTGKKFNVILGGGSRHFLPNSFTEKQGDPGDRSDKVNLIEEWLKDRREEYKEAQYVTNRYELINIDQKTEHLLGIFASAHMSYNIYRDPYITPSLQEMTEAAIYVASKGNGEEKGYFLLIESGRIDHAHHHSWAHKVLNETEAFARAIGRALELTSVEDTLIVVTSDHSHTMSISGQPVRHSGIFGFAGRDANGKFRLTLNYAIGPRVENITSYYFGTDKTWEPNYTFPSLYPMKTTPHGGEDVGIFARGPWAHLFAGVLEQHTIAHIMAYASCVGHGRVACSEAVRSVVNLSLPLALGLLSFQYL